MHKNLEKHFTALELSSDGDTIIKRFVEHLNFELGKDQYTATPYDCYYAFASVIRDFLLNDWIKTQQAEYRNPRKRVYYLSLEYLIGRSLYNTILNLDMEKAAVRELNRMGFDMSFITNIEWDAGLGNGGLGRLAACFLDSMSTLKIPAYGYGIRYEYGIFFQHIVNGSQMETPDNWLRKGCAWEIPQNDRIFPIQFGGIVTQTTDEKGRLKVNWISDDYVMAMAYDYLIPGYQNKYVNTLRLWAAKASRDFNLSYFNEGDYIKAVAEKDNTETISKVLYPKDDTTAGKELRFMQEYFFVSATLKDIFRRFEKTETDFRNFPERVAIQLNDTHPSNAIAGMMRLLVDEKNLPWETAWDITCKTIGYTNHTILPEALEKWNVSLFEKFLPRHLQIIYEINRRFLNQIRLTGAYSTDEIKALSIIGEDAGREVRMANLSIIGSHSVNGVSELHTDILKKIIFPHFYKVYPEKFNNKTNGITPRRWLKLANPHLSAFITELIGEKWVTDLDELNKLRQFADDAEVIRTWRAIKHKNKVEFAHHVMESHHITIIPESIFDFQAKRIHEYKRQLLNAMHILYLALRMKNDSKFTIQPHTWFFAGKAAPGYFLAKLIIHFINAVDAWVEKDSYLSKYIQVIFMPNYRVTMAERIIPPSDVSQQISTAGTEASGTGNMKFALNGALTIGTLDGANIEIREQVGAENFFLFGLKADEVIRLKANGYDPSSYVEKIPYMREIINLILSDTLNQGEPGLFKPILNALFEAGDTYCVIADFADYAATMQKVNDAYIDKKHWATMSIHNVAGMSKFSSDNTIKQYAKEIWKVM